MVRWVNSEIKKLFENFTVDGVKIPVAFLRYKGTSETYITYMQTFIDNTFITDDDLEAYVVNYDFDVYTKGNYLRIIEEMKKILEANGWDWQPMDDSPDFYESDTGYFHKTVCFSKIKEA